MDSFRISVPLDLKLEVIMLRRGDVLQDDLVNLRLDAVELDLDGRTVLFGSLRAGSSRIVLSLLWSGCRRPLADGFAIIDRRCDEFRKWLEWASTAQVRSGWLMGASAAIASWRRSTGGPHSRARLTSLVHY